MKILAVGAAGPSAGLVTRALARSGLEVRGLVHSSAGEAVARRNGAVETVVADLNNRDELRAAVAGVDAVFHVIPAFSADEASAGTTMVEIAVDAGIRRMVFSGVYHPSLAALPNHRGKQPAEQAIYESEMEFTILQPAMFMSQLADHIQPAREHGAIGGPYSADSRMAYVDYRDVAEVAALAFATDRFVGGTFELSAPGLYSRSDLAHELGELLGRAVRAEGSAPRLGSGIPPEVRDGLERMFRHYDEFGFHGGNSLVLETMLGREPVTVPGYLRELVAGEGKLS